MENQNTTPAPQPNAPQPAAPQPAAAPAPAPTQPSPVATPQKSNPWPWIVGGCLLFTIIIIASIFILGWFGFKAAKKGIDSGIEEYKPMIDNFKSNVDKLNEESAEWEKKSEDLRKQLPDPEELQKEFEKMESSLPAKK